MKKILISLIIIATIPWILCNHHTIINNAFSSSVLKKPLSDHNKNVLRHLEGSKNVASDLYRGAFNATSKSNRIAIAKDILKQITLLDGFIPNPTPAEVSWINTEDEATKRALVSSRRINLIDSAEFQKFKLKSYLRYIKSSLLLVINSNSLQEEMYGWGNITAQLIDQATLNDALYTLKNHNQFPNEIERIRELCIGSGEDRSAYNMCYHSYGEGIFSYIIMPYLQNQKMDNP